MAAASRPRMLYTPPGERDRAGAGEEVPSPAPPPLEDIDDSDADEEGDGGIMYPFTAALLSVGISCAGGVGGKR
jgi:hypothetical protein